MTRIFLIIPLLMAFLSLPAYGYEILVVQGLKDKAYDEALRGFKSACPAESKRLVLSELQNTDIIRIVREEKPELILAIGADALARVKTVKQVPVVYLMVLNPNATGGNVTGVSMNVSPQRMLAVVMSLSPSPKRIGLLFNPKNSAAYVKTVQQAARAAGIELYSREVRSPRDVPAYLQDMEGKIDAFWMIPDPTVVTQETVEFILLSTQRQRLPVLTFSGKYVDMGALASLDIDFLDMGKQAGELAQTILHGTDVEELPHVDARKTRLKLNRNVAKKLGISLVGLEN